MTGIIPKKISVVVPTYNRAKRLKGVIKKLLNQTIPLSEYEIIIVDNASRDDSRKVVEKFSRRYPDSVRYFLEMKRGASAARNKGASEAKADIILFMDDDMLADRRLIEEHLKAHERNEGSVLGYFETSWEESGDLFLKYLEKSGNQNVFPFNDGDEVLYKFFYTGNVSVRREAFYDAGAFDEGFKVYGVEDIDLGYRLSVFGEKCYFAKKALVFHDYSPAYKTFFKKRFKAGYSLGYFLNKFPHLKHEFSFRRYAFFILGSLNLVFKIFRPFIFVWRPKKLTKAKYNFYFWTIRWNLYKGLRSFQREVVL